MVSVPLPQMVVQLPFLGLSFWGCGLGAGFAERNTVSILLPDRDQRRLNGTDAVFLRRLCGAKHGVCPSPTDGG
jgi:hypothetical protein